MAGVRCVLRNPVNESRITRNTKSRHEDRVYIHALYMYEIHRYAYLTMQPIFSLVTPTNAVHPDRFP